MVEDFFGLLCQLLVPLLFPLACSRTTPKSTAWLEENDLLHEGDLERLDAEIAAEVEASVAFSEAGTWEPVEQLRRDVYTGFVEEVAP